MASEFTKRIYEVVRQIPRGCVASYGQVAFLAGNPRGARGVGFAMHRSSEPSAGIPCHRVVFKDGGLCGGLAFGGEGIQRALLEEEGVVFLPDGRVDMARSRLGRSKILPPLPLRVTADSTECQERERGFLYHGITRKGMAQ